MYALLLAAALVAGGDTTKQVVPVERLGLSGKLRLLTLPSLRDLGDGLRDRLPILARLDRGVHHVGLETPDGDSVAVAALIPLSERKGGVLNGYRVGFWPAERKRARTSTALPAGFIEVTAENRHTRVSKRFRLSDFLTKDQPNVWPKALVLEPKLLDKLELIADELEARGHSGEVKVMSGFRTPQYNRGGRLGRAKDSRHMYGDAADIYVDGDGDGRMDDLTGDGKVDLKDAHCLRAVAEHVEQQYPELVGGIGTYRTTRTHGPFVHVDVRGHRSRWGA